MSTDAPSPAGPARLDAVAVASCQSLEPRQVRSSQQSSLTSSVTTETPWTVADIAKAGGILLRPAAARDVHYDSEEEMRRVYTLLYDAFRYKSVLNEALSDTSFYTRFPECGAHAPIVTLLFYDLYKRRFLPRDVLTEASKREYFLLTGIPDVDEVLWSYRVRLAAALSRIRIKNNALHLSKLLPAHLRDERVVPLEEAFVTGWVNSFKTIESIPNLIERSGLKPVRPGQEYLEPRNYQFDAICPKFVLCHPEQRAGLIDSPLVKEKIVILQDRSFCLGPALLSRILVEYKLTGAVVQTHINTPRSVAYLANILVDNDKINQLLAFGAADKKEEYECYLRHVGVTNTRVFSERFVDVPRESKLLEGVVGVLATPPNSYSGIANPVDLVCSRGGDLEMLEILTDLSGNTGCEERLGHILEGQKQTLRHSLAKPQIQVVVYVTHSVLAAENDVMVQGLIGEMNQSAWERHAEDMLGVKTSTSHQSKPDDAAVTDQTPRDVDMTAAVEKEVQRVALPPNVRVIVPLCDQFEMGAIPNVCMHTDSTMEEEGCYLALLQRKEIIRLDSGYMINIAEQRGLFGDMGGGGPAKKPRSHKKRADKDSSRSALSKKPRRKIELDRIAAPTQASMQRQVARPGAWGATDPGDGSTGSLASVRTGCARHHQHTAEGNVVFPCCKHNHDSKQAAASVTSSLMSPKRVHPKGPCEVKVIPIMQAIPVIVSTEVKIKPEGLNSSWLETTKLKLQSNELPVCNSGLGSPSIEVIYKPDPAPEPVLSPPPPEPTQVPKTPDREILDLQRIRLAIAAQEALIDRLTAETQASKLRNVKRNTNPDAPALPYNLESVTECEHYIRKMRAHQGYPRQSNNPATPVSRHNFNLVLELDGSLNQNYFK